MRINNKYEILTPTGFQPFAGIRQIPKDDFVEIILSNEESIKCSLNHVFVVNGRQIFARDLLVADELECVDGNKIVFDVIIHDEPTVLYDIHDVADGNVFYANSILNHNCDTSFISSGHTVIDGETLIKYETTHVLEPIETRGIDKEFWVWKRPDYNKDYVVVADVARGDGNDYSAFHVIDVESIEQVAEYRGKMPTADYGNFLVNVATEYNDALLVIENANIGWAAIQPAIDRDYKNLYYSYKDTQVVDAPVLLQRGYDLKDKSMMVPGFTTSSKTRPMIISKLERNFREEACIVHSKRLIDELFVFIWLNGRPEAAHGYNDDLVMSFAIGMWVRDTALRLKSEGLQLTKQSIASITRSTSQTQAVYSNRTTQDPWKMKVGGTDYDLKWLIGK